MHSDINIDIDLAMAPAKVLEKGWDLISLMAVVRLLEG